MNVAENVLTKLKEDLHENLKEAVIYILDCFEDRFDDDGLIACKCYWL